MFVPTYRNANLDHCEATTLPTWPFKGPRGITIQMALKYWPYVFVYKAHFSPFLPFFCPSVYLEASGSTSLRACMPPPSPIDTLENQLPANYEVSLWHAAPLVSTYQERQLLYASGIISCCFPF